MLPSNAWLQVVHAITSWSFSYKRLVSEALKRRSSFTEKLSEILIAFQESRCTATLA